MHPLRENTEKATEKATTWRRARAKKIAQVGLCTAPDCQEPAVYVCCICGLARCSNHTSVSIMGGFSVRPQYGARLSLTELRADRAYGDSAKGDQACFMIGHTVRKSYPD